MRQCHHPGANPGLALIDETYLLRQRVSLFYFAKKEEKNMAESMITKKALAAAMKELMEERPFGKIRVEDICAKCQMNRKSFYYHFKDKYDLINWIFDIEFMDAAEAEKEDGLMLLEDLCQYLYENRRFYRKAMEIQGQNSFMEYFRERARPFMRNRIRMSVCIPKERMNESVSSEEIYDFYEDVIVDALIGMVERWMLKRSDMEPEKLFHLIHSMEESLTGVVEERSRKK